MLSLALKIVLIPTLLPVCPIESDNPFTCGITIKERLTKLKPKQDNKEVIYRKPCQCTAKYTRETGRPVEVRFSEHRRLLEKARQRQQHGEPLDEVSSNLAVHDTSNNHLVEWSEVEVVSIESHWYERKIHEAAIMIMSDAIS
jgi:hypothetical protein